MGEAFNQDIFNRPSAEDEFTVREYAERLRKALFGVSPLMFVLVLLSLLANESFACTCGERGAPPCAEYWRSQVVFTATVVSTSNPPIREGAYLAGTTVRLGIEEVFRGNLAKEVLAKQGNGADCLPIYEPGKTYFIYANYDANSNSISGTDCGRTRQLRYAEEDVEYARSLTKGAVKPSISGLITKNRYDELAGVKVVVSDGSKQQETSSDIKGHFEVVLPKPGKYTVRVILPFAGMVLSYRPDFKINKLSAEETEIEYAEEIPQKECRFRQINVFEMDLKATAEISGKAIDAEGKAVSELPIQLINADTQKVRSYETTDAEGRYVFKGLREGRYLIAVNPENVPNLSAPYPAVFYPDARDSSQAFVIGLAQEQKLSGFELRVPQKLVEREITGQLLWPDGSPVTKVYPEGNPKVRPLVYLKNPQQPSSSIRSRRADGTDTRAIDEQGRFSLTGFEGYTYVVHAHAFIAQNQSMHINVKVTIKADVPPLKLVLSLPGNGESENEIKKEIARQP